MNKEKGKEKNKTRDCDMKPCDRYTIIGDVPLTRKAVSWFSKPRNKKPTDPEPELKVKTSSKEKINKPRNSLFSPIRTQKRKGSPIQKEKSPKKNKEGGRKNTRKQYNKNNKLKKRNKMKKTKKGGRRKCITSL